jgi:hypothetical protein
MLMLLLQPAPAEASSSQQLAAAADRSMPAAAAASILSRMPTECDKSLRGKDMRGAPEVQVPRNMETAAD